MLTRRPPVLFPKPLSPLRVLAAFAGWLGVLVLPLSLVLVVATWVMYRGETDHGASSFAVGDLIAAGALIGAAHALIRLEATGRAAVRLAGGGVLGVGAWLARSTRWIGCGTPTPSREHLAVPSTQPRSGRPVMRHQV